MVGTDGSEICHELTSADCCRPRSCCAPARWLLSTARDSFGRPVAALLAALGLAWTRSIDLPTALLGCWQDW
jgi:hypothetical protein